MSAANSLYNQLLRYLTQTETAGLQLPSLSSATALSPRTVTGVNAKEPTLKPASDAEAKKNGLSSSSSAKPIAFGKPSQASQTTESTSGTDWLKLGSQLASGGLSSLLGGGLGSFGLGTVVSDLLSLFGGGKKAPPTLVSFQLPGSQNKTAYVGTNGTALYQDNISLSSSQRTSSSGIYRSGSSIGNGTGSNQSADRRLTTGNQPTESLSTPTTRVITGSSSILQTGRSTAVTSSHSVSPTSLPGEQPGQRSSTTSTDVNGQWFLDNSGNIAKAVREAMLTSSSLNDVIAEI